MRRRNRTIGPALILRGLTVDRSHPDLERLARETDPERFVWKVLPHAARSFAASIAVLPPDQARAAAVAYLYCRMLDTYEDLITDPDECAAELGRFSRRFESESPEPPAGIPESLARDARDRVYLLLISRYRLVDSVFESLAPGVRRQISDLVRAMADGMIWSAAAFAHQGGVLLDERQLTRYCRNVIGYPALFTLSQIAHGELSETAREDALLVSEMIQLANISRDIERDLERGISYHPALKPYLGRSGTDPEAGTMVRTVREEYLAMALDRAPAYRRLYEDLDLGGTAPVRAAAVLMILFTDLHYRDCALKTGHSPWPGPSGRLQVIARAVPAALSPAWAEQTIRGVESEFLDARVGLAGSPARSLRAEHPRSLPAGA
ncbi:MAG: squalene/phytoene synthase family protein [Solirubrobacterales bacterium]|nr:squalene/phytoene synthase family protein [Solirubrobacterales bacterium]